MALFKFGSVVVDARGSVGGVVFSRNRYGAYGRARVKPVNPQSSRQNSVRALMADVSQSWFNDLTQAQRDEWIVFASNVPEKNKLGETIFFSGFNQYVKSNMAGRNGGLLAYPDGPAIFTKPGEDTLFSASAGEAAQELSIVFDAARDWVDLDNAGMLVQMGIPQNDSIQFFDGPWRSAGTIAGDAIMAPTSPATIAAPFPIVENQKIFVRARIIEADGRLSDFFRDDTIVGA